MVREKNKRKPLGTGRIIVLLLCGIVFFGCAAYIGSYVKQNFVAEKEFNAVAELKSDGLGDVYAQNSDFIGWVRIDGTRIDYPVMQTPEEPQHYLYRNFEDESSVPGTPFVDGSSHVAVSGKGDEISNTDNWLIHGHNIKAGTMFHDLLEYEDREFYEEHPVFTFDAIRSVDGGNVETDQGEYEIFAVCRSRIRSRDEDEAAFRYYRCGGINDRESFEQYIEGVMSEAVYTRGTAPEYGSQLVTLSTCAYHTENGRFYIVGVKKSE